jgi:hypothetical protein
VSSCMLTHDEQRMIDDENLTSPTLIGFYPHHIDTCGPSRVLLDAVRKGAYGTENRVRDLLRGGGGHNTSTDSATAMVRRVYINILPQNMVDIKAWHSMQYFVVATGLERKVVGYAHLFENSTVGDFLGALRLQASKRLPELRHISTQRLRILGLDWKGKIYRAFQTHKDILQGAGVYGYSVDVIASPATVMSPFVEHDDDEDNEHVGADAAAATTTDDRDVGSEIPLTAGPDTTNAEDATDVVEVKADTLPRSADEQDPCIPESRGVWEHFDVYHIVQYGDSEDVIAPPTNICLNVADPTRITGETIMEAVLEVSNLSPQSLRYNTLKLLGQIILRGSYIVDSVRLAPDEAITPDVQERIGGTTVKCILVDHTECMFASSAASSKTPSPGRTPIKPAKQRAPEAVIRIAD